MSNIDLYLKAVLKLSTEAAKVIREKITEVKSNVATKQHAADFVTETDKWVEEFLISGLSKQFPDHKFIGEEGTADGKVVEFTSDPTWIIDPVDGTLNFVHGYPNVCISIALTINKELELALVEVPVLQFTFTAIKGRGAFLNGKRISVSKVTNLSSALVTCEPILKVASEKNMEEFLKYYKALLSNAQGIRSAGSAAFNLCMVASGAVDAYSEIGIHAWDYAAGALLVREAGGIAIDPDGKPLDLMARRILTASTQELANELIPHMMKLYPKRDDANSDVSV